MAQLNNTQINGNLTVTGKASLASTADTTPTSNYDLTSKKYVDDQISELNSNFNEKFPGNYHIEYAQISMAYSSSTEMRGNQYFTGKILSAVATIESTAGTPSNQVDRVIVDCNYGQNGRLEVYAQGGGFVSGHSLIINVIAIVHD